MASLNLLVWMTNPRDLEYLRKEFMKIDIDNSGYIEFRELEKALRNNNVGAGHID